MASFWFLFPLLMAFMTLLPSLSASSQLRRIATSTISAAPALLPSSPLYPPPVLSPDISPLFPSPGGVVPSPDGSSMPTIPSSQSPPNPDETVTAGPDSAMPPSESLPASSSALLNSALPLNLMLLGLLGFSLLQIFRI